MDAADKVRARLVQETERYARLSEEQFEREAAEFEQNMQTLADMVVKHDYAQCYVYEWNGEQYVGMELFKDNGYDGRYEGRLLHFLIDDANQYLVVEEPFRSSYVSYRHLYGNRPEYTGREGGVNRIEGTPFDPRQPAPEHETTTWYNFSENRREIDTLLKGYPWDERYRR